ncbi:putative DHHA2 domain, tetratricopeptide-like helical domain superfamily, DHHA2 domain superfamily [Helianthus anomalus]
MNFMASQDDVLDFMDFLGFDDDVLEDTDLSLVSFYKSVFTTSKIAALAKSGRLTHARKLFDEMPHTTETVVWNTMLTCYTHLDLYQEAPLLFNQMTGFSNTKPDHYSFTATLSACAGSCKLRNGQRIRALVVSTGYCSSIPVNNALIDMYAKCLSPCSAHKVFEETEFRNNVSWCSLLFAYVHTNQFQGKYIRARENPFFGGNTSMNNNRKSLFDFMGRTGKQRVTRSSSAIVHKEYTSGISEPVSNSSAKGSPQLDIRKEPFRLSLSDLSSPQKADDIQSNHDVEKSFIKSFNKRKQVSLPPCAASFYYGSSPQIDAVESCQSIQKLNRYLKASKASVNTGVPGQFLRVVLGPISDAGSFISHIMYSFYLHQTDETFQFCTVPVINLKRTDIDSHGELEWLLSSCNIDRSSLLFIDEVDLSYYDLFGSLKIVLLNAADKLQEKYEALKDSVIEVFNIQKGGFAYPSDDTNVDKQDCSCCAFIAEKFASVSPGILTGKGFSRLLLAGILLDTENLTSPRCTSVDRYMSTLLLNGAGRFGCNGLYQILRSKMHDVSQFSVGQILQKDFRKWSTAGKTDIGEPTLVVGMSAVGISISQLLSHNETSIQEIILFQRECVFK